MCICVVAASRMEVDEGATLSYSSLHCGCVFAYGSAELRTLLFAGLLQEA